MKIKVGVIFGGRSVEHEISVISAQQAIAAFDKNNYEITPIYITKTGKWYTGAALLVVDNYRNTESLLAQCTEIYLTPTFGDFTINAVALSLNRASRGLLIDPTNGLADLTNHELRSTHNRVFYDDPSRLLRLIRFRVRFGFTVEERTQHQYENAREAQLEKLIPSRVLYEELEAIAEEPNAADVVRELERAGLLILFSSALSGSKLNLNSITKLERLKRLLPAGNGIRPPGAGPFLFALTEKLSPRERADLARTVEMRKQEIDLWQKLEPRAKKLEHALKSVRLKLPSQIYQTLYKSPGDELLFLLYRSQHRNVQDRIRNYLQKYFPTALEVSDADVERAGAKPGTSKYHKLKEELITARLNTRKKPAPPPPPEFAQPSAPGRERRIS